MRNFSGIFWQCILHRVTASDTRWIAVLYLCCKQFLTRCNLCIKKGGMLTGAVSPFCLLKENAIDPVYCTVCWNNTRHVYTANKYGNIFNRCFLLIHWIFEPRDTLSGEIQLYYRWMSIFFALLSGACVRQLVFHFTFSDISVYSISGHLWSTCTSAREREKTTMWGSEKDEWFLKQHYELSWL